MAIFTGCPARASLALGADGDLSFPIDHKLSCSKPFCSYRLPTGISGNWTDQINAMLLLTGDQVVRRDISCIDKMLIGTKTTLNQIALNGRERFKIACGGRGGEHIGDQMRQIIITGFGQMYFVTGPLSLAFLAVASIWVVGRTNQQWRWWKILSLPPAYRLVRLSSIELLNPDPAQDPYGRHLAEPRRSRRVSNSGQEEATICTYLLGQRVALGTTWRQAIVLKPATVTVKPHSRHLSQQPVWHGDSQGVEGVAQGFADTL
jgi:hypothetical protein